MQSAIDGILSKVIIISQSQPVEMEEFRKGSEMRPLETLENPETNQILQL